MLHIQYSIPRIPVCECGNPTTNTIRGCYVCIDIEKTRTQVFSELPLRPRKKYVVPLIRSGRDGVGPQSSLAYGSYYDSGVITITVR